MKKDVSTQAENTDFEYPTERAELTILLVDPTRRAAAVPWAPEPVSVSWRLALERLLRRRMIPEAVIARAGRLSVSASPYQDSGRAGDPARVTGAPGDMFLTALYLEAEQTHLPHEAPYDVDRGLQRFSTWLDDESEPRGETSC